jgi:dTDP-4-dehydrorhamnose reductase
MDDLPAAFASAQGLLHIAASGQTTWYEFATAIVDGLKSRHVPVVTQRLIPIATKDYPAKAARPLQSRLDLTRLREVFNIVPLPWRESLGQTLDLVAGTPRRA